MGRPSMGERKRSPFRLPPTVEAALDTTAEETGLTRNDVAVLTFCEVFNLEVPQEYAKKKSRLAVARGGSLTTSAA